MKYHWCLNKTLILTIMVQRNLDLTNLYIHVIKSSVQWTIFLIPPIVRYMEKKLNTVEPRFNEVAGDWQNLFVKWRVCYIENFDITNLRGNDQNDRYIEVIVSDRFVTRVTSVEILWCQCVWHIISCWLKGCCLFTIRIKGFVDC